MATRIGLIGYGEVGRTFSAGLKPKPGVDAMSAWDIKLADSSQGAWQAAAKERASATGVALQSSAKALCDASDLVISAVTASNTLAVAEEAAKYIKPGAIFLDLNSASPGTKQQCAALIDATGAFYVEAGVMTSVPPYGIKVPMLLGGKKSEELARTLTAWDMDAKSVSDKLGVASAIKMSRSIMIKGLEALVIECYTNARKYGVEDSVLPTLAETFPQIDWPKQGAYFFSRVVQHGKRRAEEMREAANTVKEGGFDPLMASAIAEKQDWVAKLAAQGLFEGLDKDSRWQDYADRLIAKDR